VVSGEDFLAGRFANKAEATLLEVRATDVQGSIVFAFYTYR
jgi:hypothetical protein